MSERLFVDQLANEIRRVDGAHSLGAGALAEALLPFLAEHDRQVAERAWDEGRSAVIDYAIQYVENEPEHLEGYIDQHIVGIGGSKLGNPYRAAKGEQR